MTERKGFWSKKARESFRDALHLRPLTEEEAERELAKSQRGPLPDVVVDAIVERAKEIERAGSSQRAPEWTDSVDVSEVEQELVAMHRNEDEISPAVEEKLRRAREALEEEDEDAASGE